MEAAPGGRPGPSRRQALRITAVCGASLALGGAVALGLLRQARLHRFQATRLQLGTRVTVTVVHPDASAARTMVEAAFAEIERLEAILSRHRPGTPLSRLNRDGAIEGAPPELLHVLGRALEYSRVTAGAFDPTVAPLLVLYGSRSASDGRPPADAEVEEALSRVGWRAVWVEGSDVVLERPGASLTLDGIAKGWVVDRAVATLAASGAERVLLDAGGDMASLGAGGLGEPWRVALQDPRSSSGVLGIVELRGGAVASSGDYVQTFTEDRLHHHILDPRTGRSPEHTSAVSVVASTALDADALSTAAFVLGPVEGLALLERTPGVEGLIVTKEQERLATPGFRRYVS